MHRNTKNQMTVIRWISVTIFLLMNFEFVRSVFVRQSYANDTCQSITNGGRMLYRCELTLTTKGDMLRYGVESKEILERLMLRFDRLQVNCADTLSIYDGPNTFRFSCENRTESVVMIYSTNNSLSLEYVTANELGFNSEDFVLNFNSFKDSSNGCDGFVCEDENKYCVYSDLMCDGIQDCSDGSDEGVCRSDFESERGDFVKLIALACFVGFILLLGIIWLCAHTRKVMRNRAAIQRNGVSNN